MPEWSNGPDSKSGVRFTRTVGSNPTLSARILFLLHRYLLDENQFFGSESEVCRNVYELFCSRWGDLWGTAQ